MRAAELVAEYLAVGIGRRSRHRRRLQLALNRTRDFDFAIGEICAHGVADPTQFIMSHRSGYLWQAPGRLPRVGQPFERWKAATTVAERNTKSFEMQELFNRQPTSVPLYYPDENWAFRADAFDGWVESPGFGIVQSGHCCRPTSGAGQRRRRGGAMTTTTRRPGPVATAGKVQTRGKAAP